MEFISTENGLRTVTDFGELHISTDEQLGFRPYRLMVSSIVGCSTAVLKKILKKQRIPVSNITVTANVHRMKEEANRMSEISITYQIHGQNLQRQKMNKAMDLSRKHCGMIQSVQDSIAVKENLQLIDEDLN